MRPNSSPDRRVAPRLNAWRSRRRYLRVPLEVDWFLEWEAGGTFGRGLDLSPRSARLCLAQPVPAEGLLLSVCLHRRARMFRARGHAVAGAPGLVIRFDQVSPEDLAYLGQALVEARGVRAVPALTRRFHRFTRLERRFLATST